MTINVTQSHISRGKPGDSCECPIALAMRDANLLLPNVSGDEIIFGHIQHRIHLATPSRALDFISAFDRDEPVYPFSFELAPPDAYADADLQEAVREFQVP